MEAIEALKEHVAHLPSSLGSKYILGNSDFGMTNYVFWMCIVFVIVLVIVLSVSKRLTLIPTNKFVNTVEYGYEFVRNQIGEGVIGHGYKTHIPFLATLFFFILVSNFVGLIPGCKTPTGTLSITMSLAAVSFVYFNFYGFKVKGGLGYIKSLAPHGLPVVIAPIVAFLEVISICIRWLTLSIRLYANMFAGHMVLGVFSLAAGIFMMTGIEMVQPLVSSISVAWVLLLICMYALETLVAFMQAYVFTILSSVYIMLAVSEH